MTAKRLIQILLLIFACFLPLTLSTAEVSELSRTSMTVYEQDMVFSQIRPLLDLTVASSLNCSDTPVEILPDQPMNDRLDGYLLSLAPTFGSEVGLTGDSLQDPDSRISWLASNFSLQFDAITLPEKTADRSPYSGVLMLDIQPDHDGNQIAFIGYLYQAPDRFDTLSTEELSDIHWLDMQAVVTLTKDDSAPCGWKIASLVYQADMYAEDTDLADQSSMPTTPYYNETYGFSVLYPSLFAEHATELPQGISSMLPDESASLSVLMVSRSNRTLDDLIRDETSGLESYDTQLSDDGKSCTLRYYLNGIQTIWTASLQGENVLIAQMRWNMELHPDFEALCNQTFVTILTENTDLNG